MLYKVKSMENKEKRPTNFQLAMYLVRKHGRNISDEKLRECAKVYNHKPNVLIKNYRSIVKLDTIFEESE